MRFVFSFLASVAYPWRRVKERIDYWLFKHKQARAKRKSQEDDPNVYPLW